MTKLPGMFWSGETLSRRLKTLIDPFHSGRVDCAAYLLSIGPEVGKSEVNVSPNDQTADPTTVTVRKLGDGEAFTIPPGQFAFLLTEEVVSVPADALAFISIRAKTKFRGLVNVSGFHVDPGYRGQLTRQLHNIAPHLAYAEHPASSPRAVNTDSFPVCETTRKASVRRVRHPHPCEEDAHAPMGSKSPAFKGRESPLTRELCNIRVDVLGLQRRTRASPISSAGGRYS